MPPTDTIQNEVYLGKRKPARRGRDPFLHRVNLHKPGSLILPRSLLQGRLHDKVGSEPAE